MPNIGSLFPIYFTEVTKEFPRCQQPSKIILPLKKHQMAMVQTMIKLENEEQVCNNVNETHNQNNTLIIKPKLGVLCDMVGSGKSIITLSLIAIDNQGDKLSTKTLTHVQDSELCLITLKPKEKRRLKTNLIIVPHTIVKQWETYIETQTTLKCLSIIRTKHMDIIADANTENEIIDIFDTYNIILISVTMLNTFLILVTNKTKFWENNIFNRLIIDEADSIKLPSFIYNLPPRLFTWYITSSLSTLQYPTSRIIYKNYMGEYSRSRSNEYNIQHIINGVKSKFIEETFYCHSHYGYIKTIHKLLFVKNNEEFINESFELLEPTTIIIKCKNNINYKIVKGIVHPETITLINAGDITGAIAKFDCTKVTTKNLSSVVTNELEVERDNRIIEHTMKMDMTFGSDVYKEQTLLRITHKIDQLNTKIQLIKTRIIENNLCPICYDEPAHITINRCCNTIFCFQCITLWLKDNTTCPHCRSQIDKNNMIVTDDGIPSNTHGSKSLDDKLSNLKYIFDTKFDSDAKILIFSEHDSIFNDIGRYLDEKKICHSTVSGTASIIVKTINNFKGNKTNVLMLNSKYCGSGLNMENATDIIIYHSMNKDLEKQVIGRAQRPGRTCRLNIWKLCYENELG
jgi:SNF2 family DNA or RNA helicase